MSTTRSATDGHTDSRSASLAALPETTSLPSSSTTTSPMRSKSATVDSTSTTICLSIGGAMTATESGSTALTYRATSLTGCTVADSAMRCTLLPVSCSSRSTLSAKCAPRLVPMSACTSSMMMVSTSANAARACEVNNKYSDSGVVIHTSGGFLACLVRSLWGVSPVRTATRIGAISPVPTCAPARCAICCSPTSGLRRLRSISKASAFNGETYSTRFRSALGVCCSRSSAARNAARVLPDPVGATRTAS